MHLLGFKKAKCKIRDHCYRAAPVWHLGNEKFNLSRYQS